MAKYDFSSKAREQARLQSADFRAQQKIRMAGDPVYAETVRANRRDQRRKQLEKNPNYYRDERQRRLERDPDLDRKKNAKAQERVKTDPELAARRAATVRRYNLKSKYAMTVEDFDRMWLEQDERCAVCPRELERGFQTHVDHDHVTGKVRGLLCLQCNTALGKLGEDESIILSMLEYVRKHA